MRMVKSWVLCLLLATVTLSGCIDKEPAANTANQTPEPTPTPAFTVPEPSTVYVTIIGSRFDPLELKVIKGTTVKWTNMDSAKHNIIGKNFSSPTLNERDKSDNIWSYTFNETGTFEYNCSLHPSMPHGRIIVE